jgi:glucan phosphoethanolaminetransferase (alkaline phosphatase superfamily)
MIRKSISKSLGEIPVTLAKVLAVVLLLAAAPRAWTDFFLIHFDKFMNSHRLFYAVGYAAIFWMAIIGLAIIPFVRNAYVRIPLAAVIVVGYAADQMYYHVTDDRLNLTAMQVIWVERRVALDQFSTYAAYFGRDCLWVVAAGVVLGLRPARNWALGLRWSGVPLCALVVIFVIIPYTRGSTNEFPPPFSVPVMFGIVAASSDIFTPAESEPNERSVVKYDGPISPIARHVVLIVDESVRGDAIGINQSSIDNTPFLADQKERLINFGVAVAGSNCSRPARAMLRFGLRPGDGHGPILNGLAWPSIWQYAHRAGFRTVVIDAWRGEQAAYLWELPSIDAYRSETTAPSYTRDSALAERLIELLKDERPSFILVNKSGVHFPYESNYPSEAAKFPLPLQNRTLAYFLHYSDALLADYNNAIRWNVDGFFQNLLTQFDDGSVLLIYTSDHGQSLMDGGQKMTHCTTITQNTQIGEGLVPLFALTGISELGGRLREGARRAYGHASHFEIFPTLLLGMGYDEEWVRTMYGSSLLDIPLNRRRQFLIMSSSGMMSYGGMRGLFDGAKWMPVD